MGIKSLLLKPYAQFMAKKIKSWSENPIAAQNKVFENLIEEGNKTVFGKDHRFEKLQQVCSTS